MRIWTALLGIAACLGAATELEARKVQCVDFCHGEPLVDDDGDFTRRMFLNRCSRHDSFAQECDPPKDTISCACEKTSKGYRFARGSERGPSEQCEKLCKKLPFEKDDD
jgi:hypothetical protein